jgi:hypothetical protein
LALVQNLKAYRLISLFGSFLDLFGLGSTSKARARCKSAPLKLHRLGKPAELRKEQTTASFEKAEVAKRALLRVWAAPGNFFQDTGSI